MTELETLLADDLKILRALISKLGTANIPRRKYLAAGGSQVFNTHGLEWSDFCKLALGELGKTREDFSGITIKERPRKYFLTAIVAGQSVFEPALDSVLAWEKRTGGKLVGLTMRGSYPNQLYDPKILERAEHIGESLNVNENLRAVDFRQYPRNENPIDRLERLNDKKQSLIAAHPKQFFKMTQVQKGRVPHGLWSTGAITKPEGYGAVERGVLAAQDHVMGGLIVEVKDRKTFFVRQVQFDKNGGFYDLDRGIRYHHPKGSDAVGSADIMKISDLHAGWTDDAAREATWDQISFFKPKRIRIGDIFDANSITHHVDGRYVERMLRPKQFKSLEQELHACADELAMWSRKFPDLDKVVDYSNHDEHLINLAGSDLSRWPSWLRDEDKPILWECTKALLERKHPIAEWMRKNRPDVRGWRWAKRGESDIVNGKDWGVHGHEAGGGVRKPGWRSFEKSYLGVAKGHDHTPSAIRNIWTAGTMAFALPYLKGLPNNHLCSQIINIAHQIFHANCIKVSGSAKMQWRSQ